MIKLVKDNSCDVVISLSLDHEGNKSREFKKVKIDEWKM